MMAVMEMMEVGPSDGLHRILTSITSNQEPKFCARIRKNRQARGPRYSRLI